MLRAIVRGLSSCDVSIAAISRRGILSRGEGARARGDARDGLELGNENLLWEVLGVEDCVEAAAEGGVGGGGPFWAGVRWCHSGYVLDAM